MNHNWIFNNFQDMYQYLHGIHFSTNEADLTRWVFFDDEEE
jgi:hypothetical protein